MPSAGPQTMPLPRLAMCNCLTTGYSFPLENLAGPLCPVSFSCHIPGIRVSNVLQIAGNTPVEGLAFGCGQSRAVAGKGRGEQGLRRCWERHAPTAQLPRF